MEQVEPFKPTFHYGEMVEAIDDLGTPEAPRFRLATTFGKPCTTPCGGWRRSATATW